MRLERPQMLASLATSRTDRKTVRQRLVSLHSKMYVFHVTLLGEVRGILAQTRTILATLTWKWTQHLSPRMGGNTLLRRLSTTTPTPMGTLATAPYVIA